MRLIYRIPPATLIHAVCIIALLVSGSLLSGAPLAHADDAPRTEESAFLPTWKLLSNQEKRQFVSGYIFGWRDAAKVTDAAIAFARDNPKQAVEGLEKIRGLYNLSNIHPDAVVQKVDEFYQSTDNNDASFTKAMSSARSQLQ